MITASCTQWFYAKDQDGNYPSAVDPEFVLKNYSTGAVIGTYTISSSGRSLMLDSSIRYTAIPLLDTSDAGDWVRPDDETFYGCAKDVTFIYAKKEAIGEIRDTTSPTTSKSGDNVTIYVQSWNKGDVGGIFQVKLYDSDTGAIVHTFTQRSLSADASINELAYPYPVMPSKDWNLIAKLYVNGKTEPDDTESFTIGLEAVVGSGFTIRVSNALATKNVLVAHVVKMPFIGLVGPDPNLWYWPQAFDYVGGEWYMADPATTYRAEVGSIFEAIPSFNKTYGTGSFADGIHCVVLAEGDGGIGSLIFKGEDVFQLFSGSPTEIFLSSTSNDVLTEAVMGPVCDFFGIPRGSQCDSFWAEFYDPVFVANYVSISRTGKDTLGNDRELSGFDHIALPFAILGSLPGLSFLPFGALVTKGIGAVSTAGAKFGDAAVQFMLNFSMDASNFVSSKDTWYFLDAIGQVTEDHATEIVNALTAGDTNSANTLLRQYAGESKGWWDYHKLNDMLQGALPTDAYNWLRTQLGLTEIGAGTVTNTAKQTALSADDVAKLADAASDSGVMDEAASAVYRALSDDRLVGGSTKSLELTNILKNSPEIGKQLIIKYKSTIDEALSGGSLMKDDIRTIANHTEFAPADFIDMFKSYTASDITKIVDTFDVADYRISVSNLFYSMLDAYDDVLSHKGIDNTEAWVRGLGAIARKTLDAAPDVMHVPTSAQKLVRKQADTINEAVAANPKVSKVRAEDIIFGLGKKSADEIVDTTEAFADDVPTNWIAKARQRVSAIPNRIKTKWAGLERYEKVLCIWFMVDNVAFIVYMIAKFLGLGPGDRGFAAWNLAKSITDAKWLCKESCEDKRYGDLSNDIKILEDAIIHLEDYLDQYEFSLKLSNSYDGPKTVLDIGESSLKLYQECLTNRGVEVAPSTGKIVFFAVDSDRQAVIAGAYVDGWRVGTIWGSGLEISEVDPWSYDLEVKASGYIGCTKTVTVEALKTETFECTLQLIGACSPVTDVKIYVDPLSPYEDQTVSFNGSADSDNPITKWEWDFGDGSTATGQAVTHPYSSAGIYTVKLKVINDCENYATTTRNITVTEEEPPTESTTLQIETPIGIDGNEISRYWEIEIWVDGKDTACNPPKTLTFGTGVFCDCTSPWNLVPCELGTHTITLKKYGYADKSISVYMEKDTPKTWHSPVMVVSTAPPTQHTISFSVPIGSIAYVDGKQLT